MALVDRYRLLVIILTISVRHPCVICPLKLRNIISLGSIPRTHFRVVGKGIRLVQLLTFRCMNQVLIHLVLPYFWYEQRINADCPDLLHLMLLFVPAVKGTDHMHTGCMRSPHPEEHTFHAILHGRVCT